MGETILCSNGDDCNCTCNCQAFLTNNRTVIADQLDVDGNQYTFSYTILNTDSSFDYIVFCIECSRSQIEISSVNTSISIIGNASVDFEECFTPGCETGIPNSFYVEFGGNNEFDCRHQGIKININQEDTITKLSVVISFDLSDSDDLNFAFSPGLLQLKSDQVTEIINNFCIPGCLNCNMNTNTCNLWKIEKNILKSNKDSFIHFSQLLFPLHLGLEGLTITELENKIRTFTKLEKSSANLLCDIAKSLERLNDLHSEKCCSDCIERD